MYTSRNNGSGHVRRVETGSSIDSTSTSNFTAEELLRFISAGHFDAQTFQQLHSILLEEYVCLGFRSAGVELPEALGSSNLLLNDIDRMTLLLSSSLVRVYNGARAFLERELQFRCLLTSFALLRQNGVTSLQNNQYNHLWNQLQQSFQDLQWQDGATGSLDEAKFRKISCSYVLCAAKAFASHFHRAEPVAAGIISRAAHIFGLSIQAVAAAYGVNLGFRDIFSHVPKAFGPLNERPSRRAQILVAFVDTTITVSAFAHSSRKAVDGSDMSRAQSDRLMIVSRNLACEALEEMQQHFERPIPAPPNEFYLSVRAYFAMNSPGIGGYAFAYGLLDCAVQIAKAVGLESLPDSFEAKICEMIMEETEPSIRWKALEYLLIDKEGRQARVQTLLRECPQEFKLRLRDEVTMISDSIDGNILKYPYPALSHSSSRRQAAKPQLDCREGNFDVPNMDIEVELFPALRSGYCKFSGLSPDCKVAFALTDQETLVLPLHGAQPMLYQNSMTISGKEKFSSAAISNEAVAVVSQTTLRVLYFSTPSAESSREMSASYGVQSFDAKCVAIHSSRRRTCVAVAGETCRKGVNSGAIHIYMIVEKDGAPTLRKREVSFVLNGSNPLRGQPIKAIDFNVNGDRLTAITTKGRMLAWSLSNNFRPMYPAFVVNRPFSSQTGVKGLTSACSFQAPSGKPYVLGTSCPSWERERYGGEWCFITPTPDYSEAPVPAEASHDLVMKYASSIICGAASPTGDRVCLMTSDGKVMILPLKASGNGGMRSKDVIIISKKQLCSQEDALPSAIRFRIRDDKGLELFVIDKKTQVIRASFRGAETLTEAHSRRPSMAFTTSYS